MNREMEIMKKETIQDSVVIQEGPWEGMTLTISMEILEEEWKVKAIHQKMLEVFIT